MADNKVAFELVSPERLVVSMPVDMVVVPGGEGDFGVLPGHAPLIASVRPGVIEIYDGREVSDRIFVAGGFAEVTRERCTVLAESAVRVSEINVGDAEADLRSAESDLANAASDNDRVEAERRLGVAQGKLEAVRRSSH
jgi:F-type H+-transporting ATPase subunit epsilon